MVIRQSTPPREKSDEVCCLGRGVLGREIASEGVRSGLVEVDALKITDNELYGNTCSSYLEACLVYALTPKAMMQIKRLTTPMNRSFEHRDCMLCLFGRQTIRACGVEIGVQGSEHGLISAIGIISSRDITANIFEQDDEIHAGLCLYVKDNYDCFRLTPLSHVLRMSLNPIWA